MVLELFPEYGKVFWGLKEPITKLRTYFQALFEKKYDSIFARHHTQKVCFDRILKSLFADQGFKETMP